jgi:hypothetical protein
LAHFTPDLDPRLNKDPELYFSLSGIGIQGPKLLNCIRVWIRL